MSRRVVATASPSLALVKYWGKAPGGVNLPATSNLAVGLHALRTETTVSLALDDMTEDTVTINGARQKIEAYLPVLDEFRKASGSEARFAVESTNSFPTGAGIASSSSGFAALAVALDALLGTGLSPEKRSVLARLGSGSASRAVYGGFTTWERGSEYATAFLPGDHWPQLRIVVAVLSEARKPIGSRTAMERSRETSPMYPAWVETSQQRYADARAAVLERDLEQLGTVMRASYLAMFSTMFTANPPYIYWLPQSVALIHELERARSRGTAAWETMDAGPQVKIVTIASELDEVRRLVSETVPDARIITTAVGGEPSVAVHDSSEA